MATTLPGFRTELVDGGLVVNVSEVTSDIVVLIGFSAAGQTSADQYAFDQPLKINTPDSAESTWGSASDGSTLTRGIYEALGGGATEVYSFNMGQWGTATWTDPVSTVTYELFTDLGGGEYEINIDNYYRALDYVYDLLRGRTVDWYWPVDANAFDEITVSGRTTCFAYQLANACYRTSTEEHQVAGAIGVTPSTSGTLAVVNTYIGTSPTLDPATGEVSVNGTGLLGEAWQAGEVGNTILPGFYASNFETTDSLYGLPPSSTAEIETDRRGKYVDIGKYIDIIAFEPWYVNAAFDDDDLNTYTANGAGAYVGLTSSLATYSAPTNKVLSGINGLRYQLSRTQHLAMSNARYITAMTSSRGTFVVDGVTAARETSDYNRVVTRRTIQAVAKVISIVARPYIGEAMSPQMDAALTTAIHKTMKRFLNGKGITAYDFKITHSTTDDIIGRMLIYMTIVPAFEARTIELVINLTTSL